MLTMSQKKHKAWLQNLVNGQERVITLLNTMTQLHSDMDAVEFIEMYLDTKKELKSLSKSGNIESNFQEDMINDMHNDLEDLYGLE